MAGDVDVNSGKFNVRDTVVAGTLNAGETTVSTLSSGAATLSSTLGQRDVIWKCHGWPPTSAGGGWSTSTTAGVSRRVVRGLWKLRWSRGQMAVAETFERRGDWVGTRLPGAAEFGTWTWRAFVNVELWEDSRWPATRATRWWRGR